MKTPDATSAPVKPTTRATIDAPRWRVTDEQHAGEGDADRFEPDDDRADRGRAAVDADAHEHRHQPDAEHPDHDQAGGRAAAPSATDAGR